MRSSTRMGLSIITGGLAFVGAANATDLIVNGSFEEDPSIGWTGYFKTYNYTLAYFTGPPIPETEDPGSLYSWRHGIAEGNYTGPCTQTVDLTAAASAADIDAGLGRFSFSTWLASYGQLANGGTGSNPDAPYLTLQFLDSVATALGPTVIIDRVKANGFVTYADGITVFDTTTHLHSWAKYLRDGSIPPGARTATVGITHSPNADLSGTPDSYTDLVKLDVTVATEVSPPSIGDVVASPKGFTFEISENVSPLDPSTLSLTVDGIPVTPSSLSKEGLVTKVFYNKPPGTYFPSDSTHTLVVVAKDTQGRTATESRGFSVISYGLLPATTRVTPDISKRGFRWRVHQNAALQANNNDRPEQQLAGELLDPATEQPYDNFADPQFVGVALESAIPAEPTWAPLQFDIETVINMSQVAGDNNGTFKPDDGMPGIATDLNGIAGEITTYLELPAGLITMGVNSDDGFRTKGGQIADPLQAVLLGEFNGGRAAADTLFTFVVPEAGVYPFRTVWQEGDGGANIEWFTVNEAGNRVLLNDTANGGLKAYRAMIAAPSLAIAKNGASVVISFEGSLLESSSVNGPWAPLAGNSPLTLNSPAGTKFYRATR